jgi:hypothetical protein
MGKGIVRLEWDRLFDLLRQNTEGIPEDARLARVWSDQHSEVLEVAMIGETLPQVLSGMQIPTVPLVVKAPQAEVIALLNAQLDWLLERYATVAFQNQQLREKVQAFEDLRAKYPRTSELLCIESDLERAVREKAAAAQAGHDLAREFQSLGEPVGETIDPSTLREGRSYLADFITGQDEAPAHEYGDLGPVHFHLNLLPPLNASPLATFATAGDPDTEALATGAGE